MAVLMCSMRPDIKVSNSNRGNRVMRAIREALLGDPCPNKIRTYPSDIWGIRVRVSKYRP